MPPRPKWSPALGALGARRKPLQDSPPGRNPTAPRLCCALRTLSGRREYREIAKYPPLLCRDRRHFGLYAAAATG